VRLFVERAAAAHPEFRVTDANTPAIAELCCRLDGIPLAIELASAWVRTVSVDELAKRLSDRFGLLIGGYRTAPPRHQTLRRAVEWSITLLSEPERQLFNALSVFAGTWTVEAAEVVCASPAVPASDVLWLLRQLVDKSLVVVEETPAGTRYRLLETLRAYAREQAAATGDLVELERRHVAWCLDTVKSERPEQVHPSFVAAMAAEQDNLRAALRWCLRTGDADAGLRLGTGLYTLWYSRGNYTEGQAWLEEVLALPNMQTRSAARAQVLSQAGHLASCRGDYRAADKLLDEALATARDVNAELAIGGALQCMGNVARGRGELDRAEELYLAAREMERKVGNTTWECITVGSLALLLEERGAHERAEAFATEGLALAQQADHQQAVARMLALLGRLAQVRGDNIRARLLLEQSLELLRKQGYQQGLAWTLLVLARLADAEGDALQAGRLLAEGLGRARDAGDRRLMVQGLEETALLVAARHPTEAVGLAAAAAELRLTIGADLVPVERDRLTSLQIAARVVLGDAAYSAAQAAGRQQTLADAIRLALIVTEA